MNRNKAVRGFNTFRFSLVICGILLALVVTGAIVVAQPPPQILAKDAQWQQVSHAGKVWGEGVVAARDGMLYVSDLTYSGVIKENNPRGTIYRYDPATGATTKYMEPSGMSNGLHVDKHGDLIIAQDADFGGRAVLRRNLATEKTVLLADSYEGTRFNGPNDVTSDAHGRIYFTDARYGGDEPWTGLSNAFYRIDPDGKSSLLWTAEQPEIFAVMVDSKGVVYAGTSPDGKVYRIVNGKAEEYFAPQARYIWSLAAAPDGALFVGTGDQGKIFRVEGPGKGEVYYDTGQSNITGMAVDSQGRLLAGTDPNGILYRITAKDTAFALYDYSLPEIRSIVPMPDGTVYAAALGGSVAKRAQAAQQAAQGMSGIPTIASTTITVEIAEDDLPPYRFDDGFPQPSLRRLPKARRR